MEPDEPITQHTTQAKEQHQGPGIHLCSVSCLQQRLTRQARSPATGQSNLPCSQNANGRER